MYKSNLNKIWFGKFRLQGFEPRLSKVDQQPMGLFLIQSCFSFEPVLVHSLFLFWAELPIAGGGGDVLFQFWAELYIAGGRGDVLCLFGTESQRV